MITLNSAMQVKAVHMEDVPRTSEDVRLAFQWDFNLSILQSRSHQTEF